MWLNLSLKLDTKKVLNAFVGHVVRQPRKYGVQINFAHFVVDLLVDTFVDKKVDVLAKFGMIEGSGATARVREGVTMGEIFPEDFATYFVEYLLSADSLVELEHSPADLDFFDSDKDAEAREALLDRVFRTWQVMFTDTHMELFRLVGIVDGDRCWGGGG